MENNKKLLHSCVCPYCKTKYENINKARRCYEKHREVVRVKEQFFFPIGMFESGMPHAILVDLSDGSEAIYRREWDK